MMKRREASSPFRSEKNFRPHPLLYRCRIRAHYFYPAKIVARFGENTRAVVEPEEDGRYEVDLQLGTVTALLDPKRDKEKEPAFAIRGSGGVTEATGTFYAVSEYKGQTYTAVKKGEVKKKTTPPAKPDFSAYLKKAKAKADVGKSPLKD